MKINGDVHFALSLITAPAAEPLTATQVKLHSRVSTTVEDDLVDSWIVTGRKLAEQHQRKAFINQTWEMAFDSFPSMPVFLMRPPLTGVTKISYFDYEDSETVLYDSGSPVGTEDWFIVDTSSSPGRVSLAYGITWPAVVLRSIDCVKFRYACGYGDDSSYVPDEVKDAIYLYCTYRYENRADESGGAPKQFYNLLNVDGNYQ